MGEPENPRERTTLVPCPACNPNDDVKHASRPPPPLVGVRCRVCSDTRLVLPVVAAAWREHNPLMGRLR